MLEMQLSRIVIRETSDQQCIYLREKEGKRQFPIVIGIFEAWAIDRKVRDRGTQRPMTHDLLANVVRGLGGTLERVVISDLRDNTFFASLRFRRADGTESEVDARPSDAIALAVHLAAPIFVEEKVIETVLASPSEE
jgi:bifunctional DNase/RNase